MIKHIFIERDVLVAELGEIYSNDTISAIVNLLKHPQLLSSKGVVVDFQFLRGVDSLGPELFWLKREMQKKQGADLVFCNLSDELDERLNAFGVESGYEPIKNFESKEKAIDFVLSQLSQ